MLPDEEGEMAKNPYQVCINEPKEVLDTESKVKLVPQWRCVGKQTSLNEARKVAKSHGYGHGHEDVRIERVNGRLVELAGPPAE